MYIFSTLRVEIPSIILDLPRKVGKIEGTSLDPTPFFRSSLANGAILSVLYMRTNTKKYIKINIKAFHLKEFRVEFLSY